MTDSTEVVKSFRWLHSKATEVVKSFRSLYAFLIVKATEVVKSFRSLHSKATINDRSVIGRLRLLWVALDRSIGHLSIESSI